MLGVEAWFYSLVTAQVRLALNSYMNQSLNKYHIC